MNDHIFDEVKGCDGRKGTLPSVLWTLIKETAIDPRQQELPL